MKRSELKGVKRIIIKVGTNVLTKDNGEIDKDLINDISRQVSNLIDSGKEILIVSSGAIGSGKKELGIKGKIRDIKLRQAAAAVGQSILMDNYYNAFKRYDKKVGQILLTYQSFFDRATYLNLRRSVNEILKLKVIPILNENDPISIDEIDESFGDNDKMSALVASKIDAELLIMLTDTDGLYTKEPKKNKDAKLVSSVMNLTKNIESYAEKTSNSLGKGGMRSKVNAAKITMGSGCSLVIVNGKKKDVIEKVISGEDIGTIFFPVKKFHAKLRWIREAPVKGKIIVDRGAKDAILSGKNLLPAGVISVIGDFLEGDIIKIENDGKKFAKAITDYSSDHLDMVKGKKSKDIKKNSHINVFRHENMVIL